MLGYLRKINKVVMSFVILCIVGIGGGIGYLKIYSLSDAKRQFETLCKPYVVIPIIVVLVAFVLVLIFKGKKKDPEERKI